MEKSLTEPAVSIHPDTPVGVVTLRVSNLDRALKFYEEILGFQHLDRTTKTAVLSAQDNVPLLELQELTGAPAQPIRSTGLYHVAILLPGRADLGQILLRLIKADIEIGQGDHLVSEALYISDPDGNGLELYRDRPRSTWKRVNGQIQMGTGPVDLQGLVDEAQRVGQFWDVMPAGTTIGHIHLRVGDIARARHFYHTVLGFDIIAEMPTALFVSAGGYHHHIGMNIWQSRGAGDAPENTAGLQEFVIALSNHEALTDVQARLTAHNIVIEEQSDNFIVIADPWRNRIKLHVS